MSARRAVLAFTAAGVGAGTYHAISSSLSGSERLQVLVLFAVAGGYIGTPALQHHLSASFASGLAGLVYGFVWRSSLKAHGDQ